MTAAAVHPPKTAARSEWLVPMVVLVSGTFMSVLDTSIVNVAIPTIQRDFGVATTDIQWITTAYTLTLGVVVPISGWVGERLGTSRVYLACLMLFAGASALCGLAWNLTSMIIFRVLQAIPGGIMPVLALSMVYTIVPRDRIGAAMGMYGLGMLVGPAIGPTLGGYLVEYLDWRLIFYLNIPIGLIAAMAGTVLLPKLAPTSDRALDWWGFISIGSGLFALLLAITKGQDWGWTSYPVLILLVFAGLALALFVVIELDQDEPLLDLRVFTVWPFVNSLLLICVLSTGLYAVLFYLPLFMQEGQGIQALQTGLTLLPEALVMAALMPIAGRLYDKIGPRWPATIGLLTAAFGTLLLCGITPDMTHHEVVVWTCLRGAGNGLALMPIMTAGLSAIPAEFARSGSPVNNIAQRVSGALGLAALTALATNQQNQLWADRMALIPAHSQLPAIREIVHQGSGALGAYYRELRLAVMADAFGNVFVVCCVLTAAGALLALLLRNGPVTPDTPATDTPALAPSAEGDAELRPPPPKAADSALREAAEPATAGPHTAGELFAGREATGRELAESGSRPGRPGSS